MSRVEVGQKNLPAPPTPCVATNPVPTPPKTLWILTTPALTPKPWLLTTKRHMSFQLIKIDENNFIKKLISYVGENCRMNLENHIEYSCTLVEFNYLLTKDLLCCNEDSVEFFRSASQEHILWRRIVRLQAHCDPCLIWPTPPGEVFLGFGKTLFPMLRFLEDLQPWFKHIPFLS